MVRACVLVLAGVLLGSCGGVQPRSMLDAAVNTSTDEVAACRLGDAVIFLRIEPNGTERLFQSYRRTDSSWSTPEPATLLQPALETNAGKPAVAHTKDGQILLVFPAHRTPTNVDLAESIFDGQRWTPLVWLDQLNSPAWDSQPALSPDGTVLVFSSDRPHGRGGKDLYVSYRTSRGWSPPVLLPLCTAGDECTPALLADSTLVFACRRDTITGDFDLYRAEQTAPLQWTKATALPPPINSPADDIAPVAWDDHLVFSSNRNGNLDLFLMPLCGPVLLDIALHPSATIAVLDGVATIASASGLETIPVGADGRRRVQLRPAEHYLVRYTNTCSGSSQQWHVAAPCDPHRTVLLSLPAILPSEGARWEATIENAFAPDEYLPATDEHRTATALLERYNLDGAVAGATATFDRRSIAELLDHLKQVFRCAPAATIEVTIEASPTDRQLQYRGSRLSFVSDGVALDLESGMLLPPRTVALLRAYTVQQLLLAAITSDRWLSSRSDRIRWRLDNRLNAPNAVRLSLQVNP